MLECCMEKSCVSCSMPLVSAGDYPGGDQSKDFCVHCARPDGSMQSYDERLSGMSSFISRTQGLSEAAARSEAAKRMSTLPAWRDHASVSDQTDNQDR